MRNLAAALRRVMLALAGLLMLLPSALRGDTGAVPPVLSDAVVAAVAAVQARHEDTLLAVPGVVGVGVGAGKVPGEAAIHVLVVKATADLLKAIPLSLEGVDVLVVETGRIVAR
jgi:hypothetical protein